MNKNKTQITAEPGKQELTITREFDAPRELVFKAHTDPELYSQWLGPRGYETTFETFQPRTGGSYRFVQTNPAGESFGFHGVYHEVTPPERIIGTFEFEGMPERGHVILEVSTFDALPGGRTRLTSQMVYRSVADRDGMIESGMEHGVEDGYAKLDELLAQAAPAR